MKQNSCHCKFCVEITRSACDNLNEQKTLGHFLVHIPKVFLQKQSRKTLLHFTFSLQKIIQPSELSRMLQLPTHTVHATSVRTFRGLRLPFPIMQLKAGFYSSIPTQASMTIHEQSRAPTPNFRMRGLAYSHARNPDLIPTCITSGVNFANICSTVKFLPLTSKSSCHVQKIFVNNAYHYHYCRDHMEFLR